VWRAWKQNIQPSHIVQEGEVICWAAKWLDKNEIMWGSKFHNPNYIKGLHELIDEADILVAHNGNKFDVPVMNTAFILEGLGPPSPNKYIDTLAIARRHFKFFSNRLDYLGEFLGLGRKVEHEGFGLWLKCMDDDPEAWSKMIEYNKQDVRLLERVYRKLRPWIKTHPSVIVDKDIMAPACSRCESHNIQYRGYAVTNVSKWRRFQCQDCGGWGRVRMNENDKVLLKNKTHPI